MTFYCAVYGRASQTLTDVRGIYCENETNGAFWNQILNFEFSLHHATCWRKAGLLAQYILSGICLLNSSSVVLTDDNHSLSFEGRSSSASPFYVPLLQAIDGVASLAFRPQVVFQAPQHFRSSETQATCGDCFFPLGYPLGNFPSKANSRYLVNNSLVWIRSIPLDRLPFTGEVAPNPAWFPFIFSSFT